MAWLDLEFVSYWLFSCGGRFPNVMRGFGSWASLLPFSEHGRRLAKPDKFRRVRDAFGIQFGTIGRSSRFVSRVSSVVSDLYVGLPGRVLHVSVLRSGSVAMRSRNVFLIVCGVV